ncbi:MAG TPA: NAD(P)H-binding protein [Gemmatimonadaceae bacterium]|nr:NAD(P)H-binding protein [Gemmatimonadaceae bacterium]
MIAQAAVDVKRCVLVAGATGLVGAETVRRLLEDETVVRIVALSRRPLPYELPKLDLRLADFDHLERDAGEFPVDQVICALGTTIRQAGSAEQFRRVDFDYTLATARLGLERGARHCLLVSSIGANPRSRFLYIRVKGEVEDALRAMPFRSLTILRPSTLMGDREDRRIGEEVAKRLAWLTPSKFRPVLASDVAAELVASARADEPGVRIVESARIRRR